jgi:DNA transformation protein
MSQEQVIGHLPNLGPRSQDMLAKAGITSPEQLRQLGSVRAYARVQKAGAEPSLNLLWALEGALTGQPWQEVSREHRLSLLLALEAHQSEA